MKSNDRKFNIIAYYLSQYFWYFYVIIPLAFSFIIHQRTKKISIVSSTSKFNNSKDPIIFAHITDTHINSFRPKNTETFRETIELIKYFLPEFVIHTGDIVDNFNSISFSRYGEQNEENWKIYKNESSNINNIQIIEVGGNHDMFGIKDTFSKYNHIIDYSHSYNRSNIKSADDFLVHSFLAGPSQTNIIAINPFKFPTPHAKMSLYTTFTEHILNLIEKEIEKSDTKSVIICHYPFPSIHSKKSSKGRNFEDIVNSKSSVLAYLSGHWHPRKPWIFYHGEGSIEIIGTVNFKESRFGLVTIDNDNLAWTLINITNPPKGVISYPIPASQISQNSILNDIENAEIRVVTFSNKSDEEIAFEITDSSNSKIICSNFLRYKRPLVNNHSLYSFPFNECITEFGSYHIEFNGDFIGSTDFVVGNSFETKSEKLGYFFGLQKILPFAFIFIFAIHFITTFIIQLNCFGFQSRLNQIEEWIETSEDGKLSYWLISAFFGFLIIRTRFLRIPLILKIYVFISVIYCLFGPLLFFRTEDLLGFIWLYGYFINNKNYSSDFSLSYAAFYNSVVCTSMIIICSNLGVRMRSKSQFVDFIVAAIGLLGDVLILIRIAHESVEAKLLAASIGFVFIPFFFIVILIIWLITIKFNSRKCYNITNDYENSISQNLNAEIEQTIV